MSRVLDWGEAVGGVPDMPGALIASPASALPCQCPVVVEMPSVETKKSPVSFEWHKARIFVNGAAMHAAGPEL